MIRLIAQAIAEYRRERADIEAIYDLRDRTIVSDMMADASERAAR